LLGHDCEPLIKKPMRFKNVKDAKGERCNARKIRGGAEKSAKV